MKPYKWKYTHDFSGLKVGMTLHKITGSEVVIDEIRRDECGRPIYFSNGIHMVTQYNSPHNMLTKPCIYAYEKQEYNRPLVDDLNVPLITVHRTWIRKPMTFLFTAILILFIAIPYGIIKGVFDAIKVVYKDFTRPCWTGEQFVDKNDKLLSDF